eukprot:9027015-Pyramimonas_sp.AAC.1
MTRLLIESLEASIANVAEPPGDAERVMRAGAPEPMPTWDAGDGPQLCSICSGDLSGTVEVLILCGHRFHRHCLEQWRQSQPQL